MRLAGSDMRAASCAASARHETVNSAAVEPLDSAAATISARPSVVLQAGELGRLEPARVVEFLVEDRLARRASARQSRG